MDLIYHSHRPSLSPYLSNSPKTVPALNSASSARSKSSTSTITGGIHSPTDSCLLIPDDKIAEFVDLSINEDKELVEFRVYNKTHPLFVFHIPEDVNSQHLYSLFVKFGATSATVKYHDTTKRSRGFGFVHFASRWQAQFAINEMDGFVIGHKRLRVAFKKDHNK